MNETEMMYIAVGFMLSLAGLALFAMQVFQAWKDEKRKIEEDFTLSKQYEPKSSLGMVMAFIAMAATSLIFVILTTMMLSISERSVLLPVTSDLVAKFIMLMGATSLVGSIARIPNAKHAVRDIAYYPALPDDVKDTLRYERDPGKRQKMIRDFVEEKGLEHGSENFGRYFVINAVSDTNNIYILLITIQLMAFTGLMGRLEHTRDISPEFSSTLFVTGVLFVLLTIPSIVSMKKAADIEMNQKNFGKKILVAFYGFAPGIIGLAIMTYVMLPIID